MGRRQLGAGETVLLAALGAGLGVAAGFALASMTGRVTRARVASTARRLAAPLTGEPLTPPSPKRAGALARAGDAALAADVQLAPLGLSCLPLGRTGLELHGWVPNRALRARAARLLQDVAGVEHVVNCLLVRGEDDRDPIPDDTDPTTQTA